MVFTETLPAIALKFRIKPKKVQLIKKCLFYLEIKNFKILNFLDNKISLDFFLLGRKKSEKFLFKFFFVGYMICSAITVL